MERFEKSPNVLTKMPKFHPYNPPEINFFGYNPEVLYFPSPVENLQNHEIVGFFLGA